MTDTDQPLLLVYPIGIGAYDDAAFEPLPGLEAEIEQVCRLLAQFGSRHIPWPVPMAERGGDAVTRRLRHWSEANTDHNTLLYWAGHGWSNNETASLAHAGSPARVGLDGLLPAVLADKIADRQSADGDAWAFVVVEACRSARFVELVDAGLGAMPHSPQRVLLVGVSGDGTTRLGAFREALRRTLDNTFRAQTSIELFTLGRELERTLNGSHVAYRKLPDTAVLTRTTPPVGTPPITVDIDNELKALLAELPKDLRQHFLPKAQGGETGELPWYFEGRHPEQQRIAAWLHAADTGMLIVTGPPGSGKSALLGHVLAQSQPDLIAALARHDLTKPSPEAEQPPPGVFDTALLLTGLTAEQTIRRLADELNLGQPPTIADTLDEQTQWLTSALAAGIAAATLLFDALDEAQQPLELARTVVTALAAQPGVRIVVGTRRSTREGPDLPDPPDSDLIDALRTTSSATTVVTVDRDPAGLTRYLRRRLTGLTAAEALPAAAIDTIAGNIAARAPQFLFARLAVHEIAARPDLLTPAGASDLQTLIDADHQYLFATAVNRLTRQNPTYLHLLHALALSLGRGLPIRDGTWALIAGALATKDTPDDDAVANLLHDAAPYLMVDVETDQSVYRLAHRTFQEHLINRADAPSPILHRRILQALLTTAETHPDRLNPYLIHHLADHATHAGGGLHRLAGHLQVLDRLDPRNVITAITNTGIPPDQLPPALAGILAARPQLLDADPANRRAIRQIAMARHTSTTYFTTEPRHDGSAFSLRWARLARHPHHITLRGHTGSIWALAVLPGPDGRTLLASAADDGTVRLWDPDTGQPIGHQVVQVKTDLFPSIYALAALRGSNGQARFAVGGFDGTLRLWDPYTGQPVGRPLTGHIGRIWALATVPGADGRTLLASAADDGTVRLWDPDTCQPIGRPLVSNYRWIRKLGALFGRGWIPQLAVLPGPDRRSLLASADDFDGTVRLWDPDTGQLVGQPLPGNTGAIQALAALSGRRSRPPRLAVVPGTDGRILLAAYGDDGTVRLWDPDTGWSAGQPLTGHTGPIAPLAVLPGPNGRTLLATPGGGGHMVQLWDLDSGQQIGEPLTGHNGPVRDFAVLSGLDGRTLLASAGDSTIRLWEPDTSQPAGLAMTGYNGGAQALAVLPGPCGRTLLASAGSHDGTVRIWDSDTGQPVGELQTGHQRAIQALTVLPAQDGRTLLASADAISATVWSWDPDTGPSLGKTLIGGAFLSQALALLPGPDGRALLARPGYDGTVEWCDLDTGQPIGLAPTGHTSLVPVQALAALPGPDGRTLLASAGYDGTLRLLDPDTGHPVGHPLSGHTGPTRALAVLPGPDGRVLLASAGNDCTVRLWDPNTGQPVGQPLTGHTSPIHALAVLPGPDGRTLLASAGYFDGTVRIWDPYTGEQLRHLPTGTSITALIWTGSGLSVACNTGLFTIVVDLVPDDASTRPLHLAPLSRMPPRTSLLRRLHNRFLVWYRSRVSST